MTEKNIVIVGGGVIGCCTAYYLSKHPSFDPAKHTITLIETRRLAGGASGKAGGCLAEWADPACLGPASFQLHGQLAELHDGANAWGYRRCHSADCDIVGRHPEDSDADTPVPEDLTWVDRAKFKWYKPLGNTAQVHPYLFTTSMARLAEEKGVRIVIGSVEEIIYTEDGKEVQGIALRNRDSSQSEQLSATDIVLAAGPWTKRLLPVAPIGGEKSNSIVVKPTRDIPPTILFFDPGHFDADDEDNQLEIYPRPDGTVYLAGQTDFGLEIPPTTDDVDFEPEPCERLLSDIKMVSPDLAGSEVLTRQACFRPLVKVQGRDPEIGPLLGPTAVKGLILAAGHNQWGIQNAPITGKLVSQLVFDGKAVSSDMSELDPRKYMSSG
ncbi:putative FAD dependent oxidoreductase-like protein 2 [Seiridium cardinale]|uniref:FAD dependent oxidoreductase-like protein 2 n=1 Tax=Seiridium cardinale TaxID=138064 RepID=A0ABR2XXU4_9PEZI